LILLVLYCQGRLNEMACGPILEYACNNGSSVWDFKDKMKEFWSYRQLVSVPNQEVNPDYLVFECTIHRSVRKYGGGNRQRRTRCHNEGTSCECLIRSKSHEGNKQSCAQFTKYCCLDWEGNECNCDRHKTAWHNKSSQSAEVQNSWWIFRIWQGLEDGRLVTGGDISSRISQSMHAAYENRCGLFFALAHDYASGWWWTSVDNPHCTVWAWHSGWKAGIRTWGRNLSCGKGMVHSQLWIWLLTSSWWYTMVQLWAVSTPTEDG